MSGIEVIVNVFGSKSIWSGGDDREEVAGLFAISENELVVKLEVFFGSKSTGMLCEEESVGGILAIAGKEIVVQLKFVSGNSNDISTVLRRRVGGTYSISGKALVENEEFCYFSTSN